MSSYTPRSLHPRAGLRFGAVLPTYGENMSPGGVVRCAVEAEGLGFGDVWTTDHIIMARRYAYPYGRILESLITLSHVAAKTSTVRIGTSILSLPLRNPILVAKQTATLDQLSGGRLILGVGLGKGEDDIPEFEYLGASYEERGEYASEALAVIKALWTQDTPQYEGRIFRLRDCVFEPKPAQRPHPPIWWAGASGRALRRVAETGDGWQPITYRDRPITPGDYAALRERLLGMLGGRSITFSLRLHIEMLVESRTRYETGLGELVERIAEFKRAGAEHVCVDFGDQPAERYIDAMRSFMRLAAPSL